VGIHLEDHVADITAEDSSIPHDMKSLLTLGPDFINDKVVPLANVAPKISFNEKTFALKAPIYDPEKIICVGLNYMDHAIESNLPVPENPVLFPKYRNTIIATNEGIKKPRETQQLDYEVELVLVIGKEGRRIPEEKAFEHIAGYTIGHDVSARDWQINAPGNQWMPGKTFDTFAPIGPYILSTAPPTEEGDDPATTWDPHKSPISSAVNGRKVQNSNTQQLIFKSEKLVSYISTIMTLTPGDLIFTGTPPGVGMAKNPPLFLHAGDTISCIIEELGTLDNFVVQD